MPVYRDNYKERVAEIWMSNWDQPISTGRLDTLLFWAPVLSDSSQLFPVGELILAHRRGYTDHTRMTREKRSGKGFKQMGVLTATPVVGLNKVYLVNKLGSQWLEH